MKKFIDGLPEAPGIARRRRNEIGVVLFLDARMSLWYWLRRDLNEEKSGAEWVRFQMFSACRRVDLNARRAGVNHELDGDYRLVSLVMTGAYLSSKEDRGELYAMRREPSDFGGSVMS